MHFIDVVKDLKNMISISKSILVNIVAVAAKFYFVGQKLVS